ncbi:MAG: hypothetical protein ABI415_08515 [Flavitalea sp.]
MDNVSVDNFTNDFHTKGHFNKPFQDLAPLSIIVEKALEDKKGCVLKYSSVRGIYLLIPAILVILFCSSCAKKMSFQTSSVVPAAEGTVKIKKDKNNNYKIDLKIIRLASPDRLNPPKDIYVVWMNTDNNSAKNIGQIKTSSGFLSNTLKSSLGTVSTTFPTGFFITSENDGNVQYPNGQVVLKTQ